MASDASQSATEDNLTLDGRTPKKKAGRPRKTVDMKKLAMFMANYPTEENTCLFFDITMKTLSRQIKQETGLTFSQFREKHIINTRHVLVQKALYRALEKESDRMLELCLKNLNGWNGSTEQTGAVPNIILQYSLDTPPPKPEPRDVTPESA